MRTKALTKKNGPENLAILHNRRRTANRQPIVFHLDKVCFDLTTHGNGNKRIGGNRITFFVARSSGNDNAFCICQCHEPRIGFFLGVLCKGPQCSEISRKESFFCFF